MLDRYASSSASVSAATSGSLVSNSTWSPPGVRSRRTARVVASSPAWTRSRASSLAAGALVEVHVGLAVGGDDRLVGREEHARPVVARRRELRVEVPVGPALDPVAQQRRRRPGAFVEILVGVPVLGHERLVWKTREPSADPPSLKAGCAPLPFIGPRLMSWGVHVVPASVAW